STHFRVALTRGPLVYCVEQVDHPDVDVADIRLTGTERWTPTFTEALGGVVALTADARAVVPDDGPLYRPYEPGAVPTQPATVTAIPYYAWANREPGPMRVFLPVLP